MWAMYLLAATADRMRFNRDHESECAGGKAAPALGVEVMIDCDHGYTPTPVISHAIMTYRR